MKLIKQLCCHKWFILITACCTFLSACATTLPYKVAMPAQEPSQQYLLNIKPKVVLVLGSGASRGFAHAGVLQVLEENHIPIDMIIGTSAGSIVGALYADNPSSQQLTKLLLKTQRSEVLDFSLLNISRGVISGNQLQAFLVKHMQSKRFEELKIPLITIATELTTGDKHAFASGPIAPAVNASSAVPAVFQPVKLYDKLYVDGGLVDPVPVEVAKQYHPKVIIAVNLNYHLEPVVSTGGPDVLMRAVNIMMMKLNDYSVSKADVTIQPDTGTDQDGMFDASQRLRLINAGRSAAKKELPRIRDLLAKYHIASK